MTQLDMVRGFQTKELKMEYKIIIVGSTAVGKTSLAKQVDKINLEINCSVYSFRF
jgi:GTPase SAR1 family protein